MTLFEFQTEVLNDSEVHLIMFKTQTCIPCKMIHPQVAKLAMNSGIEFKAIDAVENIDVSRLFGVKKVPTYVLIKDGKVLKQEVGDGTIIQIQQFIEEAKEAKGE